MHRGVQALISWVAENPNFKGLQVQPPAAPAELNHIEEAIASPLPSDLRLLLGRWNGGQLPNGTLLHAAETGQGSLLQALRELGERLDRPAQDPELPLPYFLGADGALLAFDRSAAPVADTWPVIDCPPDGSELRLVHRTFDGWCRLCLAQWTAPDFGERFSLDGYLRSGQRHVEVEPDVPAAHATVAHALRRSGLPEQALQSYLRAGRGVPPLSFCDWEALKLALLLGDGQSALEAGRRASARVSAATWRARGTTPARVAEALGLLAAEIDPPEPLLSLLDQLAAQADAQERPLITAIRHAVFSGEALPSTRAARTSQLPMPTEWGAIEAAYRAGGLRDEDLLFDPTYQKLGRQRPLAELLRIRREF
jgi:hypothetical protein